MIREAYSMKNIKDRSIAEGPICSIFYGLVSSVFCVCARYMPSNCFLFLRKNVLICDQPVLGQFVAGRFVADDLAHGQNVAG
jgi:hypothetical protein